MSLKLRKVTGHPQAQNDYRVVHDGIEAGSIGLQMGADRREFWLWGISELPRPAMGIRGTASTRDDAMTQFRAAWDQIVTQEDIAEMREQADWTARKYAAWDAGNRYPKRWTTHPRQTAHRSGAQRSG